MIGNVQMCKLNIYKMMCKSNEINKERKLLTDHNFFQIGLRVKRKTNVVSSQKNASINHTIAS